MGRRKIEIKAIKDDRNRSVTFLKRKGGLFKKAHELSVLCSVDVAVFIFGSNKKLYEYSSTDMRDLITRYSYHGGPNEHKGPSDYGAEDDGSDDDKSTPPGEGLDSHMLPPQFQGQPPSFHHIRHHTPSASPPVQNGVFAPHPAQPVPRGHTPQPGMNSRPQSRNDMRRMGPNMAQQVGPPPPGQSHPPPPPVNGYGFMPQPAIYNHQNQPMSHGLPPSGHQYPYHPPQAHAHQMQPYMEDQRRSSVPPSFPPQAPQQGPPSAPRHSVSPPQPPPQQAPPQQPAAPHMSPPPPQQHHPMHSSPQPQHQAQPQQPHSRPPHPPPQPQPPHTHEHQIPQVQEPLPPPPIVEPKPEAPTDRPRQPPLLDTVIKKLPQRKGGSIFTPIDENRSILSQHLAAFHPEPKPESATKPQPTEPGERTRTAAVPSPPQPSQRSDSQANSQRGGSGSMPTVPETTFTPPSRSNSLRTGAASRPQLKVQIPNESSDGGGGTAGGGSATAESASPRGPSTDAASQPSRRPADSHASGVVLPPPSPSASALLSAGATGPPNPFARPNPHHQNNNNSNNNNNGGSNMNIDTPVSALPSRFLNTEFLPSPSSFYPDWNFRGNDSNTLPSPLNFTTPVVGTGPSFLREDPTPHKRKSPEAGTAGPAHEGVETGNESKRIKVDS